MSLVAIGSFIIIVFLIMLLIEVPIGMALGLAPTFYLLLFSDWGANFVVQSFFTYLDSFIFISAPLFLLGGKMAEDGGILEEIFDLTGQITKPLPGGLGIGFMICAILLGAMTGVSVAAAVALSVMLLPSIRKYKYDEEFAAGMITSGGGLAMMIPPSLPLIIYGALTETSVAKLFMAGILPGLTLSVVFCIWILIKGWKDQYPREPIDPVALKRALRRSPFPLLMPVIVLGCIYSGITTPTEAAAIMCVYAFFYGLIRRKKDFLKKLPGTLNETLRLTSIVWMLVGGAGILTKVLTLEQIPEQLVGLLTGMGVSATGFLIILFFILLAMGMFMDGLSLIAVTMPVLFPIVIALGINPLFFGIYLVVNLEIAVITPPVGLNLYAVSSVANIGIARVARGAAPFVVMMMIFLFFIIFYPGFILLPFK